MPVPRKIPKVVSLDRLKWLTTFSFSADHLFHNPCGKDVARKRGPSSTPEMPRPEMWHVPHFFIQYTKLAQTRGNFDTKKAALERAAFDQIRAAA
jgi:hypothetical protein